MHGYVFSQLDETVDIILIYIAILDAYMDKYL